MIKVNTRNLDAKRKRIAAVPEYALQAIRGMTRARAYDFIKAWQRDVRTDAHQVARLKAKTVARKRRLGYTKPETPLYGLGDRDTHTYINMMRIYALRDGYRVAPGRKVHHQSGLKLRDLFVVHEYGTTIKRGNVRIRIPARPTFFLSYEKYLLKIARNRKERALTLAIRSMIMQGRRDLFGTIHSRYARPRDFDEGGK